LAGENNFQKVKSFFAFASTIYAYFLNFGALGSARVRFKELKKLWPTLSESSIKQQLTVEIPARSKKRAAENAKAVDPWAALKQKTKPNS
jgi:hypothetical protein